MSRKTYSSSLSALAMLTSHSPSISSPLNPPHTPPIDPSTDLSSSHCAVKSLVPGFDSTRPTPKHNCMCMCMVQTELRLFLPISLRYDCDLHPLPTFPSGFLTHRNPLVVLSQSQSVHPDRDFYIGGWRKKYQIRQS